MADEKVTDEPYDSWTNLVWFESRLDTAQERRDRIRSERVEDLRSIRKSMLEKLLILDDEIQELDNPDYHRKATRA